MIHFCLCWSVGLVVIVGFGLGQVVGSQFAVSTIVAISLFRTLLRSGCVVLGMCFVMALLYDSLLLVLECWFGCDSWFGVGAVLGFQVCGFSNCGQFPL